jgi:hypothetical protein
MRGNLDLVAVFALLLFAPLFISLIVALFQRLRNATTADDTGERHAVLPWALIAAGALGLLAAILRRRVPLGLPIAVLALGLILNWRQTFKPAERFVLVLSTVGFALLTVGELIGRTIERGLWPSDLAYVLMGLSLVAAVFGLVMKTTDQAADSGS